MLGPALGLGAYAVFSGMDLISKLLDGAYPAHMLIVLNGLVALVVFMIWARRTEGEWLPKPLFMGRVATNGALSPIGLLLAFYGYRTMPTIADAYAIAFSGPLMAVVLAFLPAAVQAATLALAPVQAAVPAAAPSPPGRGDRAALTAAEHALREAQQRAERV